MSDLKPRGIPVLLDDEERYLLFTLNVDDAIQERFDMPLGDVVNLLTDKKQSGRALRGILWELLNDEAERMECKNRDAKVKRYSEKEIGWLVTRDNCIEVTMAVLKAYGYSIPEPDEFDSPNALSGLTG